MSWTRPQGKSISHLARLMSLSTTHLQYHGRREDRRTGEIAVGSTYPKTTFQSRRCDSGRVTPATRDRATRAKGLSTPHRLKCCKESQKGKYIPATFCSWHLSKSFRMTNTMMSSFSSPIHPQYPQDNSGAMVSSIIVRDVGRSQLKSHCHSSASSWEQ